jgi:hypothetical protein
MKNLIKSAVKRLKKELEETAINIHYVKSR